MNLATAFLSLLILLLIGYGMFKFRSLSKDTEQDTDVRVMFQWLARGLGVLFILTLIVSIQVSGIYRIDDPFQGPRVTNDMPNRSEPTKAGLPPELKGESIQPDVNAVAEAHKKQLERFEQQ